MEYNDDSLDLRDPVTPLGYRLQGAVVASLLWLAALSLGGIAGYHAVTMAPPEPAMVFNGADGETITVNDIVDETEPVMRQWINKECPWGTRTIAHALCRWQARKHIETLIALHGHQVAGALRVVEPISDKLFREEPARRIRGLRRLCETDPGEFGSVAVEAREDAGPAGDLRR